MASIIEFTRGDAVTHTLFIPTASWSSGGKLFFKAKSAIDDDNTDANAVISKSWDDSAVVDTTVNGVAYKQYNCSFAPADTNSIPSNGAESAEYLGEFQWVNAAGVPLTFPAKTPKIQCIVYFDVVRKTM